MKTLRGISGIGKWAALSLFFCPLFAVPSAHATQPAVKELTGTRIDPLSADQYFNGQDNSYSNGLCGLTSVMCSLPPAVAIQELTRTLSRNGTLNSDQFANNVFEYIYKNIDTDFRYGLSKGGFGALLDQSGTPFDQANLMVALLHQGAVAYPSSYSILNPTYVAGTVTLDTAHFLSWTGISNAQAACQFLSNGGIPVTVNGQNVTQTSCSPLSGNVGTVAMNHIWVQATTSAGTKLYDPSYKTYIQKPGIDLAAAMGCGTYTQSSCGSSIKAAAIPSGSQGVDPTTGANFVQAINYSSTGGLGSTLSSYAQQLQHTIEQTTPAAQMADVVGGHAIDFGSMPVPGTSLPYDPAPNVMHTWTNIPNAYRSRLNVQYYNINTWLYADETYGYWIYIGSEATSDGQVHETLFFEREKGTTLPNTPNLSISCVHGTQGCGFVPTNEIVPLVNATISSVPSYPQSIALQADHPYAANSGSYGDDALPNSYLVQIPPALAQPIYYLYPNSPAIYLIQSWGTVGRGYLERMSAMAADKQSMSVGPDRMLEGTALGLPANVLEGPLTNTSIPSAAATWFQQASMARTAIDGINRTLTQTHHMIGVALDESLPAAVSGSRVVVDAIGSLSSTSTTANTTDGQVAFSSDAAIYDAFEGSSVEQTTDTPDGGNSIRWMQLEGGSKFFEATPSNIDALLANVTYGYHSTTAYGATAIIDNYMHATGQTWNMVLPQYNGLIYGVGPLMAYSNDGSALAYITTTGLKGADTNILPPDPVDAVVDTVNKSQPSKAFTFEADVATGGLNATAVPDIVTGPARFPQGLPYQRYYSSKKGPGATCYDDTMSSNPSFSQWACIDPLARRSMLGWDDNYQIDASFSNDGLRGLGLDSALDASSAIAALYALRDLNKTTCVQDHLACFQNNVTTIFTAAWLEDSLGANAVVVNHPPAVDTFIRLPDGRYNPRAGMKSSIAQSSARAIVNLTPNGPPWPTNIGFDYTNISLSETLEDGSVLTFSANDLPIPNYITTYVPTLNRFKPSNWNFPDGASVSFAYTRLDDPQGKTWDPTAQKNLVTHSIYSLTGVSNSFGRSLTFGADPNASSDPDGYTVGFLISDENVRSVSLRYNNGAMRQAAGTKIIAADGTSQTLLAFDRNDNYSDLGSTRLTKLYLPADHVHPFETFDWDGLRRLRDALDGNSNAHTYFPADVSSEQNARGEIQDALGNVTTSYFDDKGHPLSSSDPLGRVTMNSYDGIGRLVQTTHPEGNYDIFSYDVRSNLLSTTHYPVPGSAEAIGGQTIATSTIYEEAANVFTCANLKICNKPKANENGRGFYTDYQWDSGTSLLTQVVSGVDVNGNCQVSGTTVCPETDLGYAAFGGMQLLKTRTEKISASASTETDYDYYDSTGKYAPKSQTVDAGTGKLNLATTLKFDGVGNLIELDGPRTDVVEDTHYQWDSLRRLTMTIKPDPDGSGAILRRAAKYTYQDEELKEVDNGTVTDAAGDGFIAYSSGIYAYDTAHNKVSDTETAPGLSTPLNVSQFSYDADERPLCTVVRMNPAAFGSLPDACTLGTQGTYGADRITETIYDAAGQKRQEVRAFRMSPPQIYETFDYTANGLQKAVADSDAGLTIGNYTLDTTQAHPHQTNYAYDGFDRVNLTTFADGSFAQIPYGNGYDADGNVLRRTNRANQTVSYTYDAVDRVKTKSVPAVAGIPADSTTWTYDLRNEITVLSDSLGNNLNDTYDAAKRLTRAKRTAPGLTGTQSLNYQYDQSGHRTRVTWPDGYFAGYGYDAAGKLWGACENAAFNVATGNCGGGTTLAALSYDNLDNLSDLHYGGTLADVNLSWATDGDLLTLNHNYVASADVSFQDLYSPAHQVTSSTVNNASYVSVPGTFTNSYAAANGLNQYTAVNSGAANGHDCQGHAEQFSYDCNGNLTSDGVFSFAYDPENHLMSAASPASGMTASYAYDPLGRRSAKTVNGVATYFLDSGEDEVGEYSTSATLLRRYVPGTAVDHPLAMIDYTQAGNPETYFHQDKTGSVVAMSNTSGNVTEGPYTYDPYGAPSSAAGVPYKFDGMRYDTETGCYYDRARYYCPGIGRFLQTDPIGYKDDIDWYDWAHDDPANGVDPSGTCFVDNESHWGPCWLHDIGLYETRADKVRIARNFFAHNPVARDGKDIDPSKLTDDQVLQEFKILNDELRAIAEQHPGVDPESVLMGIGDSVIDQCCFVAGTLVDTKGGLRAIESLKVGDLVLSRDEKNGRTAYQRVRNVFQREDRPLYEVKILIGNSGGHEQVADFDVTSDHPWRTDDGRWLATEQLKPGTLLRRAHGPSRPVISVTGLGRTGETFNLDVANYHTYFVGADRFWVHNGCSPNQMNSQIQRGQAPFGAVRVDTPKVKGEKLQLHIQIGSKKAALNSDGTWKHGNMTLTKQLKVWLTNNGWKLPPDQPL